MGSLFDAIVDAETLKRVGNKCNVCSLKNPLKCISLKKEDGKYNVSCRAYLCSKEGSYDTLDEAIERQNALQEMLNANNSMILLSQVLKQRFDEIDAKLDMILTKIDLRPPTEGGSEYVRAREEFNQTRKRQKLQ